MDFYTYQTRYNTPTIPTKKTALVHNPLLHNSSQTTARTLVITFYST